MMKNITKVKDSLLLITVTFEGIEAICKSCGKVIEVSWPGDWL